MKKGKFVVIEGGLGCGKTTQISILQKKLKKWQFYREPGGTQFGEMVREAVQGLNNYLVDEFAAFLAYSSSRANLVRGVIQAKLNKGKNIILDRYWFSTYAYQSIGGVSKKEIIEISKIATGKLLPDLVIFYDLDPKIGIKRKRGNKDADRYDVKEIDFHKKVRRNYKELAKKYKKIWVTIDASKSIDEINRETLKVLKERKII
jgi:dTMP kinase